MALCTPGTNWTKTWTDSWGQTTYKIEAPCKVFVGQQFPIVLTVTDLTYRSTWVGGPWSILDNGATIASGSSVDTNAAGSWQFTFNQKYLVEVVNHQIEFKFVDLGRGAGMSGWGANLIGDLTVDPYPTPANMPPTAAAGIDVSLRTRDQASAAIAASATDADGDALTYRWLEGDAEIQAPAAVEAGAAPLALSALAPLSTGTHVFTLEVSDGTDVATDDVTVTVVPNTAPLADAGADAVISAADQASTVLPGNGSDADGDALTYRWLEEDVEIQPVRDVETNGAAPLDLSVHAALAPGDHVLTLVVSDGEATSSDAITLTVVAPADYAGGCGSAGTDGSTGAALLALVGFARRRRRVR